MMLRFNDVAHPDDGPMSLIAFALTGLPAAEEVAIAKIAKKAAG